MQDPRVSVLLPTYNAGQFVAEAIESILEGTFRDFEILIIDDGSTDGTVETVHGIQDDRVRCIQRDKSGLVGALNRGIEASRGSYIARQDADDRSRSDRLKKQVQFLDTHPDVAVVGSGAYLLSESGTRLEQRHVYQRLPLSRLLDGANLIHGSAMMRREAVEEMNGYDEFFEVSEDYDLWVRLAQRFTIRNIDEPLYSLRLHNESIYGAQLRLVKLYAVYARKRAEGTLTSAIRETVRTDGVAALYRYLTRKEKVEFHRELSIELLRYGDRAGAREHARRASRYSTTDPLSNVALGLSFAPNLVVRIAGRLARAVKNTRIRLTNLWSDSD